MARQTYAFFVEGLQDVISSVEEIPESVKVAAYRAINRAAERGRTMAAVEIARQVNFPKNYLSPAGGRLTVAQKAQKGDLEARVRARTRATSLARFAGSTPVGKRGVSVEVAPGRAKFMKRAFLIRLPAGRSTETKSNLGLAIRLRPGETLENKTKAVRMEKNLYLLYGPSVDQAFLNEGGTGVAADIAPDVAEILQNEFMRLLEL